MGAYNDNDDVKPPIISAASFSIVANSSGSYHSAISARRSRPFTTRTFDNDEFVIVKQA
jgi:hypothetical protein